jgi:chromatin segregation and condensation protein Rec8/ScpA/Scc1 (kleisin family)
MSSRGEKIATFLAILELMRLRLILAHQPRARGDIYISLLDDSVPTGGTASPGQATGESP